MSTKSQRSESQRSALRYDRCLVQIADSATDLADEVTRLGIPHQRKSGAFDDFLVYTDAAGEVLSAVKAFIGNLPVSRLIESAGETDAALRAEAHSGDTLHDDFVDLLNALKLGDHARPTSMHEIVQNEILPAIERLKAEHGLH